MTQRVVVFDLDDTLYLEREYVRSGFEAVARLCEQRSSIARTSILSMLWEGYGSGVRGDAFDRLLLAFPELGARLQVDTMVEAYRTHHPVITIEPEMARLLSTLRSEGVRLSLITDGAADVQRRKSEVLGLHRWFEAPVFTGDWGREYWKPHQRGFVAVEDWSGLPGTSHTYVGDNPAKDFIPARARGWHTIRLRLAGQLHEAIEASTDDARPDTEARTVATLTGLLLSG